MRERYARCVWLLGFSSGLPLLTWILSGMQYPFWFGAIQAFAIWIFSLMAVLLVLAVHLLASLRGLRAYVDPLSAQLDLRALWRERHFLDDAGFIVLLMLIMNIALSGVAMIAELYRHTALEWHDAQLWALEEALFAWLQTLPGLARLLGCWEWIYHSMWVFVLTVLALLVSARRDQAACAMIVAAIQIFYLAHVFALVFPTAGPALYWPEAFPWLEGSQTAELQAILSAYQQGDLAQNGVMYGLQACPSVHIGLAWLAGRHLLRWKAGWWPLVLAVVAGIWGSTVVLGWHYVLDGLGGLLIAELALFVAGRICRAWWGAAAL